MEGQNNRLMGRKKGAFLYVTLYVTYRISARLRRPEKAKFPRQFQLTFISFLFRFFEISHVTFTSLFDMRATFAVAARVTALVRGWTTAVRKLSDCAGG